jgi:hypothetical protein
MFSNISRANEKAGNSSNYFNVNPVSSPSCIEYETLLPHTQSSSTIDKPLNLLMCTQARVQFGDQLPILAQVFLDSGSQRNLVSKSFADKINATPIRNEKVMMAGFDAIPKLATASIYNLIIHGFYGKAFPIEVIEMPKIVGPIHYVGNPYHESIHEPKLPTDLLSSSPPDILIGIKDYLRMEINTREILPSGFRRMQSQLGDLITGEGCMTRIPPLAGTQVASPMITFIESVEDAVHPMLSVTQDNPTSKTALHIDQIGEDSYKAPQIGLESQQGDDEAVHEQFLSTGNKENNRYIVSLPWKVDEKPKLEANVGQAFGRFQTTMRKLRANPELRKCYHQENPPTKDVIRDLSIFQDARRILRCHGRFVRSDLDAGTILPIYIPPTHQTSDTRPKRKRKTPTRYLDDSSYELD